MLERAQRRASVVGFNLLSCRDILKSAKPRQVLVDERKEERENFEAENFDDSTRQVLDQSRLEEPNEVLDEKADM